MSVLGWNPNIYGWQPFAAPPAPDPNDPSGGKFDPSYIRNQGIGQGLTNAGISLLMGGDPRMKQNFGQAIGQALGGFSQGMQEGQGNAYRQGFARLQAAKAGPELAAAQRENRMGQMTENYYRQRAGLPPIGGADPASAPQLGGGGASGGAPGPVPGVAPAGVALGGGASPSAAPQQPMNWRQQLYNLGMDMVNAPVPGLADQGAKLIETAQKAPDGFQFTPDFQNMMAIGGGPQDPAVLTQNAGMKAGAEARAKAPYEFHTVGPGAAGFFGGAGGGSVGPGGAVAPPAGSPPPSAAGGPPRPGVNLAAAPRVGQPSATGGPPMPGAPSAGGIVRQGGMIVNTNTPQQLNISTNAANSYTDTRGKDLAGTMKDVQAAGDAAKDSIRQIGELSSQLGKMQTGTGTDYVNEAAKAIGRMGWDINQILPAGLQANPVAYDAANKNISELAMVVARANFPGGRITNSDLASAIRATPNLFNMPGANQILIDNLQNTMRLKVEQAKFYRQYANAPTGAYGGLKTAIPGVLDDGVSDAWSQYVAGIKNIPDNIKQSFLSYSDYNGGNSPAPAQSLGLPQGADQMLKNKSGNTIYRMPQPGGGYKYVDQNGQEVR